jgi:hypothetical protein
MRRLLSILGATLGIVAGAALTTHARTGAPVAVPAPTVVASDHAAKR